MRRLDRWVGVPLCFLATLGLRLFRLCDLRRLGARQPATAAPPGRVLYVALAEMGSIVLAVPAIRRQVRLTAAPPSFVTLAPTRAVFDFLGGEFAADVRVLRSDSLATLCADLWSFARWARRNRIEVAIDLDPGARFSALVALLSGAPRRAAFAGAGLPYRGQLETHSAACPAQRHMSKNFSDLVQAALGTQRGSDPGSHGLPAAANAAAAKPPAPARPAPAGPLLLIHANVSDPVPQRRWPRQRYFDLCRRLLAERPDARITFIGAAAEAPAAAQLCADLADRRCGSVAGSVAIVDLPMLFGGATLLLASDSGPAHFAAHAGLPVVALFGPETPLRYRPLGDTVTLYAGLPCSPCLSPRNQRASACRDARCMQAITVDAVLDQLRPRLGLAAPVPSPSAGAAGERLASDRRRPPRVLATNSADGIDAPAGNLPVRAAASA